MSRLDALQVTPSADSRPLTPSQKRFNTLIRQIEQTKQTLSVWTESTAAYRQAHHDVLAPLQAQLLAGHRQWVFALDAALARRGWTKAERETLRDLVCEATGELLEAPGSDPELEALFARHAEVDFATEQREATRAMKGIAEAMTGLDLGDDESIASDADVFERLEQGFQAQAAARQAERDAKAAGRRKTAAQQRRDDEAQQATQSVREIYRKLASALHPDREADAQQRAAKTALMQRVNQSYEANDLLGLLELQLQIEQIDASHIAGASEQRLKHYNKVLGEQLAGIKSELAHIEIAFRLEFGLEPGWGLNPRKLGQLLEQTRRAWRGELDRQQRQLHMLDDVAATRRWLKREQKQRREDEFDFSMF